jgi:hypothetical protein
LKYRGAAALFSMLLAAGSTAQAANRHVDIVNKTGKTLTHFYASGTGTSDWEDDILGRDTIDDGDTFDINIDDGSGACRYDFKAVFEGGGELIKNNINVCQISTFTYSR